MRSKVATGLNESAALSLPAGAKYDISFSSAGAFALRIQKLKGDGVTWEDVYDGADQLTVDSAASARQGFVLTAGTYRMYVTEFNNDITMWAQEI